jgi:uncharacterized membrane protein
MRQSFSVEQYTKAKNKRTIIAAFIIFVLIPATILWAVSLGPQKTMLISILILIYVMVPFFLRIREA